MHRRLSTSHGCTLTVSNSRLQTLFVNAAVSKLPGKSMCLNPGLLENT